VNSIVFLINKKSTDTDILFLWLLFGLAVTILEATSRFTLKFLNERLHDDINLKVTSDILIHADSLELSNFEDIRFQNIIERASRNTAVNLSQFITSTLSGFTNLIQSASLIGLLIFIDPLIVILMLPVAFPYLIFQWRLSKTRYYIERSRTTKRRWTEYFVGLLTKHESVPEIKVLGLGNWLISRFADLMKEFKDQDKKLYLRSFIINIIFGIFSTTAAYVVLTRVSLRAFQGAAALGDVAIFGGAAIRLKMSIENTILALTQSMEQTLYISNLIEFFKIKPKLVPSEGISLLASRAEIELKNVSFAYPGSGNKVLKNISLHIKPGETVALVGENGAGKTTLVKIIVRLYEPDSGSVLFDGHEIWKISLDYLYSQVSFVFQTFGRYEATVSENIAIGDYKKLLNNRKKIEEISYITNTFDLISRMPAGYDTKLGRSFGEYALSGGQWQQIALARAFARDSKLLILDEPTSNLDAKTEYEIFRRFQNLSKGRTTILISHRFSTVSIADRILVMDQGEIIEQGTHQELVALGGHYAGLYDLHRRRMAI
jgi:ATP-binding cassette subfamily B protein